MSMNAPSDRRRRDSLSSSQQGSSRLNHDSRKSPRKSPSRSSSPSPKSTPASTSLRRKERKVQGSRSTSPVHGAIPREYREYDSPNSDHEPDEVHTLVSKATDTLIQKTAKWVVFFKARAAPQRVSEVLKQYQYVQKVMDELVGKKAPFVKAHYLIEAVRITLFTFQQR
jgi:hypothetical protein